MSYLYFIKFGSVDAALPSGFEQRLPETNRLPPLKVFTVILQLLVQPPQETGRDSCAKLSKAVLSSIFERRALNGDSEFGIRNSEFGIKNSEFGIKNSEFIPVHKGCAAMEVDPNSELIPERKGCAVFEADSNSEF